MNKAVGYVRVSTHHQVKGGESLTTQRKDLNSYAKKNEYELVKIYADEGISGGSVEKRPGLRALLKDARNQSFSLVLVNRLSRLGRNARELLNNVQLLKEAGISVVFLKENIDLSNAYGQFMLTMLAAMAELEKDILGESSVENKIALAKKGVPSIGKYPFGRRYNRETEEWYFDPPDIKEVVNDIADRYLNGEGLRDIADTIDPKYQLTYSNILKVFHGRAGNTWELQFKKEDKPIVFEIPRLLSDEKIEAVMQKIDFNRTFTKSDRKSYTFLLTGFARCMDCGTVLTAQHQKSKPRKKTHKGYTYKYYRHRAGKREKCKGLTSIKIEKLENAVLNAVWENMSDEDSGFDEAWTDNYPDQSRIGELKNRIKENQKKLNKAEADRDKLVDALLKGILTEDAIKKKNDILSNEISRLTALLTKDEQKLSRMPSVEEVKGKEEMLKLAFQDYYYSRERFDSMTFEEKRALMFSIFDGVDEDGDPLGVYVKRITPIGELPVRFEIYINARFFAGYVAPDTVDDDDYGSDSEKEGNSDSSSGSSKVTTLQDGRVFSASVPSNGAGQCGFLDSIQIPSKLQKDNFHKTSLRHLFIAHQLKSQSSQGAFSGACRADEVEKDL
ncbi:MAG: recombinase family protein [Candidatus Electrothrix sp. YB6]